MRSAVSILSSVLHDSHLFCLGDRDRNIDWFNSSLGLWLHSSPRRSFSSSSVILPSSFILLLLVLCAPSMQQYCHFHKSVEKCCKPHICVHLKMAVPTIISRSEISDHRSLTFEPNKAIVERQIDEDCMTQIDACYGNVTLSFFVDLLSATFFFCIFRCLLIYVPTLSSSPLSNSSHLHRDQPIPAPPPPLSHHFLLHRHLPLPRHRRLSLHHHQFLVPFLHLVV